MSSKLEVSLGECLEVKGSPLDESEIWAVLVQSLERIYSIFSSGKAEAVDQLFLPITPDSLLLCQNGQVDLARAYKSSMFYEDCLPPEFLSRVSFSAHQLEKMYIYSLGMTIYSSADYKLKSDQELQISPKLDELLNLMCCKNPGQRISLDEAIEACSENVLTLSPVLDLYMMVMGENVNMNLNSVEEKSYDYGYESFKRSSARSTMRSKVTNENNTIHYILLDRGAEENNLSGKSRSTYGSSNYRLSFKDGVDYVDRLTMYGGHGEPDIEEAYSRLNDRRKKLEILRKGLKKYDDGDHNDYDFPFRSNLNQLSNTGMLRSTPNLANHLAEEHQPLSLLSAEYEWLDKKAKEIDAWRKAHLKTNEMIITPEPHTKDTNLYDSRIRFKFDETEVDGPHLSNFAPRPDASMESLVLPAREQLTKSQYFQSGNYKLNQLDHLMPERERLLTSDSHIPEKDGSILVDEEVQTVKFENPEKKVQDENFMGPEFRHTYPVVDLVVREASSISESNVRHAKVKLLNGAEVDVVCCANNTGQHLYDCLAAYLTLHEHSYFGLAAEKVKVLRNGHPLEQANIDDELYFLEKRSKLSKMAPQDWSQKKKFSSRQTSNLVLNFCVQYFVPNLSFIRYRSTLHLFYLQLRQHIISGNLQTSDITTNFLLAGLALRAEYGDDEESATEGLVLDDYLSQNILTTVGRPTCRQSVLNKYRSTKVSRDDAEMNFVKECMRLDEYGHHFYRISKHKNSAHGYPLWTGIGLPGITVGRESSGNRVLEIYHRWGSTLKVSYNRHRFSISDDSKKFNYYTDTFRKCRYLLWLCSDQHNFGMYPKVIQSKNNLKLIDDRTTLKRPQDVKQIQYNPNLVDPQLNANKKFQTNNQIQKNYMQPVVMPPMNRFPATTTTARQVSPANKDFLYDAVPSRENDVQLPIANKLESRFLNEPSHIELSTFGFHEPPIDPTNYFVSDASKTLPSYSKPQPTNERVRESASNNTLPFIPSESKASDDSMLNVPPPPSFTIKGGSYDRNNIGRAPLKAPRLFKTGSEKIALPSMNLQDLSNSPENVDTVEIPTSSGVKINPLFVQEDVPDEPNIRLPRFSFSPSDNDEAKKQNTLSLSRRPTYDIKKQKIEVATPPPQAISTPVLLLPRAEGVSMKPSPLAKIKNIGQTFEDNESVNPDDFIIEKDTGSEVRTRMKVTLEKKPPGGYGIGLARDRKHEGVFVVSLMPGGVAERDGRLKPGDQITTVNNEDVTGSTGYSKAVQLLSHNLATMEIERKLPTTTDGSQPPVQRPSSDASPPEIFRSRAPSDASDNQSYRQYSLFDVSDRPNSLVADSKSKSPDKPEPFSRNVNNNNKQFGNEEAAFGSSRTSQRLRPQNHYVRDSIARRKANDISLSASRIQDSRNGGFSEGPASGTLSYEEVTDSQALLSSADSVEDDEDDDDGDDDDMAVEGIDGHRTPEAVIDVFKFLPKENDVVFSSKDSEFLDNLNSSHVDRLRELPHVPHKITDSWLTNEFENKLKRLKLTNYDKTETLKLIKKMENQLTHDQPLIEFKSLDQQIRTDLCTEGSKIDNRLKNRYQNVLPFDSSRVILQPLASASDDSSPTKQSDYINASHVRYPIGQREVRFVATQGPLINTVADFWIMIWQNGVTSIAMATKDFENGQNKCCRYWPDHELLIRNRLKVTILEVQHLDSFDIKFFRMTDTSDGKSRLLCQISFLNWPDGSTTSDSISLIKFISAMEILNKDDRPVVIHCSAGIGRTGVVMVTKICLELIRHDMKFDIKNVVDGLRKQRGKIVQTKQQYQLCYRVVLQLLQMIYSL